MSKYGKLYMVSNPNWNGLIKCGVTSQNIEKRMSNLNTGNPENCEVIYMTEELIYPYYYEKLLKEMLKESNYNREFYKIEEEEVKKIYKKFNEMNKILSEGEEKKIKLKYSMRRKKKKEVLYVDCRI